MSEAALDEFKGDLSLLIEAGFVAVKQLDEVSANRIFQAAQCISPTSTAPQIGLGYIALNKLEVKEAIRIFEQIIAQEPENWLAQTFLGISLLLNKSKREKGEAIIKEAMSKTSDPTIKSLGELALEWVDKDLPKSKSPLLAKLQEEPTQIQNEPIQLQEEPTQIQNEPTQMQDEPTQMQDEPTQIQNEK